MDELELLHWGIKGMTWGVRRYQNKDGTLTPAGKKRYNAEMERLKNEEKILKNKEATRAKLAKLETKQKEINERKKALDGGSGKKSVTKKTGDESEPKRKSVKDMSDEELAAVVRRAQLEKQYRDLNPQKVSAGKKFFNTFIVPTAKNVGKNLETDFATKKGKEWLGLTEKKEEDPLKSLQRKVTKLTLEERLKELEKNKN